MHSLLVPFVIYREKINCRLRQRCRHSIKTWTKILDFYGFLCVTLTFLFCIHDIVAYVRCREIFVLSTKQDSKANQILAFLHVSKARTDTFYTFYSSQDTKTFKLISSLLPLTNRSTLPEFHVSFSWSNVDKAINWTWLERIF